MAIIEIKVPSPGESISEVELYRWLVKDGEVVEKDTEVGELESDKATLTLAAEESGKVSFNAKEGDTLKVGSVALTIDTSVSPEKSKKEDDDNQDSSSKDSENSTEKSDDSSLKPKSEENLKKESEGEDEKEKASGEYSNVKTTPLAKKMMEENDLSVDDVIKGLRRLKQTDVEKVMNDTTSDSERQTDFKKEPSRETKEERMSSLRRKLSQRLVSVKNETAMLTTFNEVDMKPIMDIRKKYQKQFIEKHDIKLGFMSFFMKACARALLEFPGVNSMIDGENIIKYEYADISVAVSTPKGLMVPVIRNVESLSLAEIEKAIAEKAEKARNGKLSIPEMTGGTFTITNGGIFGSMMSTPIINPPQSAILGMHNIIERPVAIDGQIVIRPMMYLAVSYDHRIIDGRESVSFLVKVKQLLENPTELLFNGKSGEEALLEL